MTLRMDILKDNLIYQYENTGKFYRCNDFILNDVYGGPEVRKWVDENFEARVDDIYVASFPKTGTTWAQELVYVIANDLNFQKARESTIITRFPFIENKLSVDASLLSSVKSPRLLKTHYPYTLLPKSIIDKKCKIIYTIRNPKDTCVSFYHFLKLKRWIWSDCEFKDFFDLFVNDLVFYGPFWKHLLEYWEHRNEDNLLILCYEDMKKDIKKIIEQVASFIGKTLSEEQVNRVAEHCDFKNMKSNPATNYDKQFPKGKTEFIRKGEVGDWKNHFTFEMNKKMDDYVEKHFNGTGLKFVWEL